MASAKKILEVSAFPRHSIRGKNAGSTERDAKRRPNQNSRESNRDRRQGAGSKAYRPQQGVWYDLQGLGGRRGAAEVESTKRSREGREEVAQQCSIGTAAVLHTVVPWRISADGSIPPLPHLLFFRISTLKERNGLNKLRIREFYSNAANSKERRETRNAAANLSTDFLAPPLHVSRSLARCNDARSHARTRAKPRTLTKRERRHPRTGPNLNPSDANKNPGMVSASVAPLIQTTGWRPG